MVFVGILEVYPIDPRKMPLDRLFEEAFLDRHGYIYHEGSHWTDKHFRWLRNLEFENPMMLDIFDPLSAKSGHQNLMELGNGPKRTARLVRK